MDAHLVNPLDKTILISIQHQRLQLFNAGHLLLAYAISTAKNGVGEENGSGCTPSGLNTIRAKIGADSPMGTVFVGRRPTSEVFSPKLDDLHPNRDWILTLILWLSGCEPVVNRCGSVDSLRRYIYIHGCIRMRNADVIDLFDRVRVRTTVQIVL